MDMDDLLKDSIDYIETRIQFVDRKASILLAIEIGIITGSLWILEDLFGYEFFPISGPSVLIMLILGGVSLYIQIMLLQTIRPTERILSNRTSVQHKTKRKGIMWPRNIENTKYTDFVSNFNSLTKEDLKNEYLSTLYTSQFLVEKKYYYYRKSVFLVKWQVIIYFFTLSIVAKLCS